jgi:hypothetical protein
MIAEIGRIIERNIGNKALNSKEGEDFIHQAWESVVNGFPLYGFPVWVPIFVGICIIGVLIAYSVAGKGMGSHAGREEVRRAYRRQLAREMAKQDAAKIRAGEKPRRRWMQW